MSLSKSSIKSQHNLTEPNLTNRCTYEFEDFRLDAGHLMLYRGDRTVELKPKVVETLVALVERAGDVVSNDELMDRLWADSFVEESNLTQNIYLLRKTLGDCSNGKPFIENFSRRGYRFNGEVRSSAGSELLFATHTKTQTVIEETFESKTDQRRRNWMIVALTLAIVFAAAAYVLKDIGPRWLSSEVKNSAVAPFQDFKLKRHSGSGDVENGVVSPDGKFIAFTAKKSAIWLKNTVIDSGVLVLPESETAERHVIAISPQDDYIYFLSSVEDKKSEVLKMPLFGGGVQQKIVEDVWSNLSLSPDGKQLSFVRGNGETGENALIVANTDGTGERTVVTSKEGTWFGTWSQSTAWSPDGSQIACAGGINLEGKSIWVIKLFRVADGEEISLIRSDFGVPWISAIAWLPDGDNLLAISGNQSSEGQIYKHTISSGEWRRVTNDLSDYDYLSVTKDGKTVITTQHENLGNLWILPADRDSSEAKQITFGQNLITDTTGVSWTPDGKIVYATNAGGRWEIWTIGPDGANQKQLTQNCAGNDFCSQPVVSPNGSYIVFQASRSGVSNIWRMDGDGTNATQLTFDDGRYPSITPDGRFVIYTRQISSAKLWQVPIEGGESQQFSKMTSAAAASVSPDGNHIAFGYYDKTAKQPFQTCASRGGADAPKKCFDNSRSFPRWAPDGKSFYYLAHGYAGIWKQPLDGERVLFLSFVGEH